MVPWAHMSQPQTAFQTVQPFLHTPQQSLTMLSNGLHNPKITLPLGDLDPHLTHGSLGPPELAPKWHLDQLTHFCTAHPISQHIHTTCDICRNRPHRFHSTDVD